MKEKQDTHYSLLIYQITAFVTNHVGLFVIILQLLGCLNWLYINTKELREQDNIHDTKGNGEPTFDFETAIFSKIATTSAFVDKTLLIKEVLINNKTAMIAAPPKFGKSTNLDMIRTFLEIEVDENGRSKSRVNFLVQPIKDTDNFRLFDDNNFKITHEVDLMNEYFGRTPVLSISFKCDKVVKSLECAVNHFKEIVHETFKKYLYILKSDKLSAGHKEYIENWCSDTDYKMFGKHRVSGALRELAEYLWRHFDQRRVFVLIDDHDSVIKNAMLSVTDDDVLNDITKFSVGIMNAILKSNSRYVQGGVVTGVSDIPAFGSPAHNIDDPDSFQIYRFLDDHRFVNFYGLTQEEVKELCEYPKMKLGENVIEVATQRYGGYQTIKGKQIYNMYSVLRFLREGEFKTYWPVNCPLRNISEVIKIPFINECINKLLKGNAINMTVIDEVEPSDIVLIKDFILEPDSRTAYLGMKYLFFLMGQGFLTYTSEVFKVESKTHVLVKLPNDEIKEYFAEALK